MVSNLLGTGPHSRGWGAGEWVSKASSIFTALSHSNSYQISSSIMNVTLLNHHEAFLCPPLPPLPPCHLWKNCLPGNQLLLPKKGTTALDCQSISCPWLQWLVWGWAKTKWKTMKLLLKVLKETHLEAESRSMRYWPATAALTPWRKKGQHSGDPVRVNGVILWSERKALDKDISETCLSLHFSTHESIHFFFAYANFCHFQRKVS